VGLARDLGGRRQQIATLATSAALLLWAHVETLEDPAAAEGPFGAAAA
jgi:hypothetical protein